MADVNCGDFFFNSARHVAQSCDLHLSSTRFDSLELS